MDNIVNRGTDHDVDAGKIDSDGFMTLSSVRDASGRIVDFRYVFVNDEAGVILRRSASSFAGRTLLEEYPGSAGTGRFQEYVKVVESGRAWSDEFPFDRDGQQIWMRAIVAKAGDGFAVTFTDLTEKEKAREAARLSEERFRFALEAAGGIGTWDWHVETDIVIADGHFAEYFGVPSDMAARGAPLTEFLASVHHDDATRVKTEISHAVRTGADYECEYRVCGKGDQERWIVAKGRCQYDDDGRPIRFPGAVIDITDRKRTEQALQASEAGFSAIVDSIDQMVWSTRPDGYHDFYNARWYEFTGVPANSTDGEGWNDIFHPDDREEAWRLWRHSLKTGDPYYVEYRLRHRSGEYRWVIGRARPVLDAQGSIVRWYGTCTDVHDLKMVKEERELIARELAHRVKNSFSLAIGLISLSARSHPDHREFADLVRERLQALAHAQAAIGPIESGKGSGGEELEKSVRALFESVLHPFAILGVDRIVIDGCDSPVGDNAANPLALLVHELATNAAKYGALSVPDGQVKISCHAEKDGPFVVEWTETGGPTVGGPPSRVGFGTNLLDRVAKHQLGAAIEKRWMAGGLEVRIVIPDGNISK